MFDLLVVLIPGLPLLAALANSLNALFGERYSRALQVRLATASVLGSFLISVWILFQVVMDARPREVIVYRWLLSGDLSVNFAFLIDSLSAVMMLVTTSMSFLIAVFSINYMHNERGFARFFSVLPLFVAAMLVLVMANNYVLLFLGWEAVGVCSYMLISFYQDRTAAVRAGTKAFVMNRVGDAGFLIAIFLIFTNFGTTDYLRVFSGAAGIDSGLATAIGVFLMFGAMGKSAQLPLAPWLARAMEGPTPSSALIHAATMVTAGVYMVTRSQSLYAEAPNALLLVAIVGAVTALYGALVGLVQTDIKSILAYSTTTQLGLMFFACGLGAYAVAIFHLAAHALFKTLLFLTAPSILHHLHGRADVRDIGPARPVVPGAAWPPLIAASGLVAFPFLSSWWQVEIVRGAWKSGLPVLLAAGAMAMFAAAFAAGRMVHIAFAEEAHHDHVGEHGRRPRYGKAILFLVLIVALALLLGVLPGGMPGTWFEHIVDPVVDTRTTVPTGSVVLTVIFMTLTLLLLTSGWFTALYFDRFRPEQPGLLFFRRRQLYNAVLNRFWLDDIYDALLVRPVGRLGRWLDRIDTQMIDSMTGAPRHPARIRVVVEKWEERLLASRAVTPGMAAAVAGEDPGVLAWLSRVRAQTRGALEPATVGGAEEPGRIAGSPEGLLDRLLPEQREESHDRLQAMTNWATETAAGMSERMERHDRLQGIANWATEVASTLSSRIEQLVFHRGIHIGMPRAGSSLARAMIRTEERLGQPWVIGFILAVWVIAVLVGYGWS